MVNKNTSLIFFFCLFIFFIYVEHVHGAVTLDSVNGIYTNDFNTNTGLYQTNKAKIDVSDGKLKLTNATNTSIFTAPFATSGYAILSAITPSSTAAWGTLSLNFQKPTSTQILFQVLDGGYYAYDDTLVAGNSTGFSSSSTNFSTLSITQTGNSSGSAKYGKISFKLLLSTSDASTTPSIDDLSFSWAVNQGDLSTSTPKESIWYNQQGDNQGTQRARVDYGILYPSIRWVKTSMPGDGYGHFLRGSGDTIYHKSVGGLVSWPWMTDGVLRKLNRHTGEIVWEKKFSGYSYSNTDMALSQNDTIYNSDIYSDIMVALDGSDGSVKWTYQFSGGHGNQDVVIGPDGSIYTMRYDNTTYLTVYAFNANGTVRWTKTIVPPGSTFGGSPISLASDGSTLYFGTYSKSGANFTNNGLLYALNTSDGSIKWTYPSGDFGSTIFTSPIVDVDGSIYITNSVPTEYRKRITAVTSDGSLKWEYSIGTTTDFWRGMALREDGVLLVERFPSLFYLPFSTGLIEAININDGSLLWSKTTSDHGNTTGGDSFVTNNAEGLFRAYSVSAPSPTSTFFSYYDAQGNEKWSINKIDNSLTDYIRFYRSMQDEDGWVYVDGWGSSSSVLMGIAPWTLNASLDRTDAYQTDTIVITATSSMQQISPLTNQVNKIQIVFDNGATIPLVYNSSDDSGNSIWRGTYTIPTTYEAGVHQYTVEAGAAEIRTDITTRFSEPANNSNNTGITLTGSFNIKRVGGALPSYKNTAQSSGIALKLNNAEQQKGNLSTGTQISLSITKTLRFGMIDPQVIIAQKILQKVGTLSKEITPINIFGPKTLKAVKQFQVQKRIAFPGLAGYGQIGPKTRKALNEMNIRD